MRLPLTLLASAMAVSACATGGGDASSSQVYDPLEPWNRGVFAVNESIDKAVLEPAAKGYRAITNEPIRGGVSNILTNLNQPVVFANTVLQGKPTAAFDTATRFLLNTTLGLGGVFDPASYFEVPKHREDFGQTLGVWGVPSGPYLMLPIVGPSNLRDAVGSGVDRAFDPFTYARYEGETAVRITQGTAGALSARESLIEQFNILREQPEPYVALRRTYTQGRAAAIRDGRPEDDPFKDLPDFDDYDFGDED
ncbi:MAG: VacJ family lipoprotein [Pseudomonadota bacterium]